MFKELTMKLIENWRDAPRMFSVQAMVVASAVQSTWVLLPEDMKATIPTNVVQIFTVCILACGILGRVISQAKPQQ
jgi:hypothetical protein